MIYAVVPRTPRPDMRLLDEQAHVAVGATTEMNPLRLSPRNLAKTYPVKGLAARKRAIRRTPVQVLDPDHNALNAMSAPNWRQKVHHRDRTQHSPLEPAYAKI